MYCVVCMQRRVHKRMTVVVACWSSTFNSSVNVKTLVITSYFRQPITVLMNLWILILDIESHRIIDLTK